MQQIYACVFDRIKYRIKKYLRRGRWLVKRFAFMLCFSNNAKNIKKISPPIFVSAQLSMLVNARFGYSLSESDSTRLSSPPQCFEKKVMKPTALFTVAGIDSVMSGDEKQKLYEAIGYSEGEIVDDSSFPLTYVGVKINFSLKKVRFALSALTIRSVRSKRCCMFRFSLRPTTTLSFRSFTAGEVGRMQASTFTTRPSATTCVCLIAFFLLVVGSDSTHRKKFSTGKV